MLKQTLALAALVVCCAFLPAHAASPSPDVTLRGEIRDVDLQTYRLVPFEVPTGVSAIAIEFDYTGREQKTVIDLGLLEPGEQFETAFRGWSGGSKRSFGVSKHDATPSYHPGPIAAGRWHLVLGVPNIRKGHASSYTATIRFERDASRLMPAAMNSEARWYRGDLHMHSAHSDGSCNSKSGTTRVPCPLFLTLDAAADRGLDFVAVTEHNTNSHVRELTAMQPYFDRLLLIPGMEITTFQGHANAFNVTRPVDFRVGSEAVPDWNTLLRSMRARDAIVSINHPSVPSGEICMGCGWLPRSPVDYSLLSAVEVVNGHEVETPISGIAFWHEQLQKGVRLTAIGGSDTHDITSQKTTYPLPGQIGIPTTVVYAAELSTSAILDGIRAGKVFIDTAGTTDRMLELTGTIADRTVSMGDSIEAPNGTPMQWHIAVKNLPGGKIEVIRDGVTLQNISASTIIDSDHETSFEQRSDGREHWIRVNVRDADGKLALIGNPIYINR
jgi:hypothetical protein